MTIRPIIAREEFDELAERITNIEQALLFTQNILNQLVTEWLDDDIQEDLTEAPERPQQAVEDTATTGLTDSAEAEGFDAPPTEAELAAVRRARAVEEHERAKRAASAQPVVIDGQAMPQQPVEVDPTSPEQMNETAGPVGSSDPLANLNSLEAVGEEGNPVSGLEAREWKGEGTHIQRRYDDRGNPLDG